jgi:nitroreductase
MELLQAIKDRRSIRKFKPEPVERELLASIIKNALWAPSAMNIQPWKFFVAEGASRTKLIEISNKAIEQLDKRMQSLFGEKMRSLVRGYFKDLGGAPSIVVVVTAKQEEETCWLGSLESAAAAIQNFCLLAHEAGLSTCWMSAQFWVEKEILEYLGVADDYRLAALIPTGYADQTPPIPPRKHEDIIWLG